MNFGKAHASSTFCQPYAARRRAALSALALQGSSTAPVLQRKSFATTQMAAFVPLTAPIPPRLLLRTGLGDMLTWLTCVSGKQMLHSC